MTSNFPKPSNQGSFFLSLMPETPHRLNISQTKLLKFLSWKREVQGVRDGILRQLWQEEAPFLTLGVLGGWQGRFSSADLLPGVDVSQKQGRLPASGNFPQRQDRSIFNSSSFQQRMPPASDGGWGPGWDGRLCSSDQC